MRPLEIGATLCVVASILSLLASRFERPWFATIAVVAAILVVCHSFIEGIRWQMLPIYVTTVILVAYAIIVFGATRESSILPSKFEYVAGILGLIIAGTGIFLSTALPVFKLPAPTGPYRIGTQIRHIVDSNRPEPFVQDETRARELMIQIWYPADVTAKGPLSTYRKRNETTFWNARYSLATTHAIVNAAMSARKARYPVVVFAPSWWGGKSEATFQAEELASYGFIVVGMDHPYSTRLTAFPDGRLVRTKLISGEDYSSDAGFQAFIAAADEQVRVRAEDAQSVLDALERINTSDPAFLLTGHLDMTRVGILGYSIGGGAAAQACWLDHRFVAGVDLDGMLAADSEKQGTRAPFLFIFGGFPPSRERASLASGASKREADFEIHQSDQVTRSLSTSGGVLIVLPGQEHASFSDGPFYSPLNSTSYRNAVSAEQAARLVSKYVIAFFNNQFGEASNDGLFHLPPEIPGSNVKKYERGN